MNAEARAPAHVYLLGDLVGETGALVLALPLPLRVRAAVTLAAEPSITVRGPAAAARVPLEVLVPMVGAVSYEAARETISKAASAPWQASVFGVLPVLARERRGVFDRGAVVEVESPVPLDGGLGIRAALGVAALSALARAYGVTLGPNEAARLAHRVQALLVRPGAAPFETLAPAFAKEGEILPIVCRPDRRLDPVAIPEGIDLLVFETAADAQTAEQARVRVRSHLGEGAKLLASRFPALHYVAEAGVHALEEVSFPEGTREAVAYALRENERAAAFLHETKRFAATKDPAHLRAMGRALDEAEEAARACRLPSPEAADLVAEVRSLGEARGVFGARTLEGSLGIALVRTPDGADAVAGLLAGRPPGMVLCAARAGPAGNANAS